MGPEEPFRQLAARNLYLVDGRNHCWRITRDPATATGVVLARQGRRHECCHGHRAVADEGGDPGYPCPIRT